MGLVEAVTTVIVALVALAGYVLGRRSRKETNSTADWDALSEAQQKAVDLAVNVLLEPLAKKVGELSGQVEELERKVGELEGALQSERTSHAETSGLLVVATDHIRETHEWIESGTDPPAPAVPAVLVSRVFRES